MPNTVLKDGEAEIRLHQFMEEPAVSFYADQVLVEEVPNGYKVIGVQLRGKQRDHTVVMVLAG